MGKNQRIPSAPKIQISTVVPQRQGRREEHTHSLYFYAPKYIIAFLQKSLLERFCLLITVANSTVKNTGCRLPSAVLCNERSLASRFYHRTLPLYTARQILSRGRLGASHSHQWQLMKFLKASGFSEPALLLPRTI